MPWGQAGSMDAFNYLSVMVSIVLGLGLTQLFAGIGNLVQIRRRVKLYWLHTFWVLLLIGLHLHMWWSLWALRAMVLEPIMGLRPFFVPFRILQAVGVVTFGSCSASKNRRLHAVATALIILLLVTGITLDRFSLGQFALH